MFSIKNKFCHSCCFFHPAFYLTEIPGIIAVSLKNCFVPGESFVVMLKALPVSLVLAPNEHWKCQGRCPWLSGVCCFVVGPVVFFFVVTSIK